MLLQIKFSRICKHSQNFKGKIFADNEEAGAASLQMNQEVWLFYCKG